MAGINAPTAPTWLAGSDCTFEEALLIGRDIAEKTAEALPTLPRKDASRYLPATVSDALSLVHAREDAKKKNAGNKVNKAKQKSGAAALFGPDERIPGAKQGGGDPGVFWLYSEDFFRDATQEDLHDILPRLAAPKEDPAFAIGPPGSGAELPALGRRPLPQPLRPPPPPPPPNPFANADGSVLPDDALLGMLERRSSRRASKSGLGSGSIKYNEGDEQETYVDVEEEDAYKSGGGGGGATGTGGKSTGGAVPTTVTRAMKVPTTPHGTAASTLWDVVPSPRIALLALQLSELMEISTGENIKEKPLTQAEKAMATAAANGKKQLNPNEISQLVSFIENKSSVLSKTLKCSVDVDFLGLRRGGAGDNQGFYDEEEEEEEEEEQPRPSTSAAATAAAKGETTEAPASKISISLPFGGFMHPYTQLVLQSKVPQHVKQAAIEAFGIEPVFATAAGKTPTAEQLAAGLNADGQPAGTGNNTATTSAAGMATPAGTAPTSSIMAGGDDDLDDVGSAGDMDSRPGSAAGRASSRQRGVSNYALMAGRKDPVKAAAQAAARKLTKDATAAAVAQAAAAHPVSQAVSIMIAAGAPDEDAKDVKSACTAQWNAATEDPALLAAAPQDEIAAETVALQAELAAISAANRVSLVAALDSLVKDLPNQKECAAMRAAEEAEVIAYYTRIREEKKKELKIRREAAHREALAAAGAQPGGSLLNTPRPVLGHHILAEGEMGGDDGYIEAPFLGPDDMYDVLAQRGEDDEAFCAVCGEGHSQPPNVIIFCDRCDVAVHQMCYDLHEVPENEWLCWPCREYEDMQRAAGVPQCEIRNVHALPDERTQLPGGSRDVKCALCPIRCGAFRKTVNGEQWVHQTCASWHPECYLVPSRGPNCIDGLNRIPTKRWTTACDICGKVDGAVINCKHPGTCQYNFHVMCARNCGLYLTVRPDFQGKPLYRIYCAIHSKGQQEKDAQALQARIEGQSKAAAAANDKALRAQIRDTAMLDLAYREDELIHLRQIRVNLENTRLLVDQCKRREKIKKQLIATKHALHAERLQNPLAAVGFLNKIAEMEQQGMTPGQILEAMPAIAEAAGPPPPPPLPEDVYPALALDSPEADAVMEDDQVVATIPSGTTAKRAREGEEDLIPGGSVVPGASPATTDGGGSKRARRGQGPESVFDGPPEIQQQQHEQPPPPSAARPTRSGASGLSIERQRLMSSAEAQDINSKLPPKFKYVPIDQLEQPDAPAKVEEGTGQEKKE